MYIFASIVHNLRTNNVNVYVSKIYPRGLIFGMLLGLNNFFFFWGGGGVYLWRLIYRGHINKVLRYFHTAELQNGQK